MAQRKLKIPQTLYRTFGFERASIDEEKRTVELSFSSEAPVERYFGIEILDHGPKSVKLDRLRNTGPLLFNHDRNAHIGRVMSAYLSDRRGKAVVRFGSGPLAEEKFRDVKDGILTEVSVGYRINDIVLEKIEKGVETYRIMEWEPGEVSLVTMPADTSVGVGREKDAGTETKTINVRQLSTTMDEDPTDTPPEGGTRSAPPTAAPRNTEAETQRIRAQVISEHNARMSTINDEAKALIGMHAEHADAIREHATKCIVEGTTIEGFRKGVLHDVLASEPVRGITQRDQGAQVGLSKKDRSRYSLLRAIRCQLDNKPLDGLERECSDEVQKIVGRAPQGFFMPDEIAMGRSTMGTRTMNVGTPSAGGFLVGEQTLTSEFVDFLRNNTQLLALGARMIPGLVGDVKIPRQISGATAYWVSETGSLTSSEATFGQIVGSPKRIGTSVPYSKQLLAQTSLASEAFVIEDSQAAIAVELDRVGINGSGNGQPLGILNLATAARSDSVTFGAAPTYAKYLEFFTNVAGNNALVGRPAYLTTPGSAGVAMGTQKFSGAGGPPIWTDDNRIGVFPAAWTTQFPTTPTADQVIFGDFSQVVFLEWAGYDVVIDPYSGKKEATVEVTINRLMDMVIRRAKSFSISADSGAQ